MNEPQAQHYEFGNFCIDTAKRLLLRHDGELVPLTPKVFDTLLYMVRNSGTIIEKDELMSAIWMDTIVEENNLNKNISTLRRILGEKLGENHFIATIPGKGYKFVAEVHGFTEEEIAEKDEEEIKDFGIWNLESEINKDQRSNTKGLVKNRFWLVSLIIVSVLAISSMGFYFWRDNAKTIADTPIKTLAVLPFKPLVVDNRNETLELGMADSLISKLSGGEELAVRPISSVRKYVLPEQDSLVAGRELGVEAILDGTIQNWGDRVRISARLLRTGDGKQLWAGQFDEKLRDIFAVQDSISERVATAL